MPQQRKRKTAEEILGIAPKRKSAEEILGIAPQPAPQTRPQQEPQGILGGIQSGLASKLLTNVVETAADFYNAPGETLERIGRAGLEFASAFDPAGNAYQATVQSQAPRVAELNRRADERLPEPIQSMKRGMAIEAERPRTAAGNIAYGAGSVLGDITFPTSPENAISNIALIPAGGAAAKAAGKVVAPVLRRLRGGAAAAEAVSAPTGPILRTGPVPEGASVRAQTGVARLEAPGATRSPPPLEGPPLLEEAGIEDFTVSLGKERASTPGKVGPRYDEAVELEIKKQLDDPTLGTKAERTPVLETISALRKAGLLTGLRTHIKNVGGTGAFQISEELSRIPGAVADMVVGGIFAKGRRTYSGPSLGSMGRSAYEAATTGISEAKKAIRTGQTKFDLEGLQEIASGSKVIDAYVNGVFRTLKAEDAVFRAYAVRRSLEDRAKALALNEARKGTINRGQVGERTRELLKAPPADMEAAALLDAEVATFNNSNVVADALTAGIQKLPKGGQFIVDQIVPFRKTPTNVIFRMLESSPLGFGKNAMQLARGIAKKSFTEAEQRAFSQTFGRASLGSGLIALGYKGYKDGWLTGLIEDEPSRRSRDLAAGRTPGSIKVGDTWHQLTGFAPFGPLLAIGATLARETEQEQEGAGTLPALEVLGQAVGEQPLLVGTKQVAEALAKPGSVGEKFVGGYAGSLVPTAVSDVAEAFDPQQREATGITGRAQARIPALRNTLPPAQDVLGQPRQDLGPVQAFLDPTRATTDVASSSQLFAELVRLDVGLSGFEKEKKELTQRLGAVYLPAGQQLVSSREYAQAPDEVKREAVKILNRRAKATVEDDKPPGGNLSPASVLAGAVSAVNKQKAKKNAARK